MEPQNLSGETDEAADGTRNQTVNITLQGFPTEQDGNDAGALVAECLSLIALQLGMDLARLDGMTIAHDYDRALAQLDRGFTASTVLTRTVDEAAVGVAMTPRVMRNGRVMSACRVARGHCALAQKR